MPASAIPDSLAAALAGRYLLERELGRGGMATVYLAQDLRHDRPVALKVLNPELAHALGSERFLREVRVTARLQHPHILPVHDSGVAEGLLWYTMPFVDGDSLRQRLKRDRQLPVEEAVRIASEVADALEHANERGVVHRDIKPENILLSGGHALVADFGLARALDQAGGERLTGTGVTLGTPAYMSPEQASGTRDLDGRSDLYSLSCVLYEMIAGEPPFTGSSPQATINRRFIQPPTPLRHLRASVSEPLDGVVLRALERNPGDRFTSAAEFATALKAAHSAPVGSMPRAAAQTPLPTRRLTLDRGARLSRRLLPLGMAMLLVLIGFATALLWRSRAAPPLDPDLVALAPFDVLDPSLQRWHEGLVEVLSGALHGRGPLRTVPPTVVVRRWRGRADPASAAALGYATGAGLVVYGSVMRSGTDSVRLAATVLDVARERGLGEVEVRGPLGSMYRLTDSLAVGLERRLGHTHPDSLTR